MNNVRKIPRGVSKQCRAEYSPAMDGSLEEGKAFPTALLCCALLCCALLCSPHTGPGPTVSPSGRVEWPVVATALISVKWLSSVENLIAYATVVH